jgi:hypothetical protein
VIPALLLAAAVSVAAVPARGQETPARDCGTRAFGDLGADWRPRATVAGPLALVGMRNGLAATAPTPAGTGERRKILVVVEPGAVATLAIAPASREVAALAYLPQRFGSAVAVPLAVGSVAMRFEACARPNAGAAAWNRGTQFPGYFLVAGGRRCVQIEVAARGRVFRRTLRFGAARC